MPKVGLGVIIENTEGKILVGKRKGSHAPYYSIPGGHLERGESFEVGAVREIKEETDLEIKNPRVVSLVNDLETYNKEGRHYISIILSAKEFSGELKITETEKCEGWLWVDPIDLPQPHFYSSQKGVELYLKNKFY